MAISEGVTIRDAHAQLNRALSQAFEHPIGGFICRSLHDYLDRYLASSQELSCQNTHANVLAWLLERADSLQGTPGHEVKAGDLVIVASRDQDGEVFYTGCVYNMDIKSVIPVFVLGDMSQVVSFDYVSEILCARQAEGRVYGKGTNGEFFRLDEGIM